MPTLTHDVTVRLERTASRTVTNMGMTATTGHFITGEDVTGRQNTLRARVRFDRSNARTVRQR